MKYKVIDMNNIDLDLVSISDIVVDIRNSYKINYDCKANVITCNRCPFEEKCLNGQINF